LDNKSSDNLELYKKSALDIDDYCLYFHEVTFKLLIMLRSTHSQYCESSISEFIDNLSQENAINFTNQLEIYKSNPNYKEYISLLTLAINLLLDDLNQTGCIQYMQYK